MLKSLNLKTIIFTNASHLLRNLCPLQMFLKGNRTDQESNRRTFSSRNTANVYTDIRAATLNNHADFKVQSWTNKKSAQQSQIHQSTKTDSSTHYQPAAFELLAEGTHEHGPHEMNC